MKKPTFMSYEEWMKEHGKELRKTLPEEEWHCDACYGNGEHECSCGDSHECHACGGTGENFWAIYKTRREEEEHKWNQWHTKKTVELITAK